MLFLNPHPATLPCQPYNLEAQAKVTGTTLDVAFRLTGDLSTIVMPPRSSGDRRDELWQTTCFEVFAGNAAGAYREFNLSPSTAWATYDFDAYRKGMHDAGDPVTIQVRAERYVLQLEVTLPLPSDTTHLALTAVIEEIDGRKSYWSLAHPPERPDFHHRDCFVLPLASLASA